MKKFVSRGLSTSPRTKSVSYILAVMLAIQPLLNDDVDPGNRPGFVRFLIRLIIAATVAFLGKYLAQSQEKD